MTVIYVEEISSGRTAKNSKGVRSYQAQFCLITTSQTDRPYDVGSHPSLPLIGSPHPDDPTAFCTDLDVVNSDPWAGWTVTAAYSTEREISENPLLERAVITWGSDQFQRPAVIDKFGNLIVNSAGDPFDPPAMIDDSRVSCTVTKNVSAAPSWLLEYHNATNSDSFIIDDVPVAARTAKVQAVSLGEWQSRSGIDYRVLSYTLSFQYEGWPLVLLDQGMRKISGSKRVPIPNADSPVPLDGTGQPIAEPTYLNAVSGTFYVYREVPFSALPMA